MDFENRQATWTGLLCASGTIDIGETPVQVACDAILDTSSCNDEMKSNPIRGTALSRTSIMVALFLTAVPVASMEQSSGSVLPALGIERPTTRADTMRNAISIHDEVSTRVCAPTAEAASSLIREQSCPESAYGQNALLHFYWTWLIRILACVGILIVACLAFTSLRTSKGFLPITVTVAVLALLDTGNLVLGGWSAEQLTRERLERAEWQWRLDLAAASALPGEAGGKSALNAAQRYAAAVSQR